jgi:O-antigen/teichoic acid export membrane protein
MDEIGKMDLPDYQPYKLASDIIAIVTSRERLRQLLGTPFYSTSIYIMVSGAVTSFINFFFWVIVTRLYSPESVGLASAVIAAVALLAAFAHLGLGLALIRFLPQSGRDASSLINTALTIGTLASSLGAFIFVAGLGLWSPALLFLRHDPVYFSAFVILTIASVLSSLVGETFVARRRAGFVTAQNLMLALLRLPMLILLANLFHSFGILAAWGISLVASLFISVFLFLPKAQPGYRPFFSINGRMVSGIAGFSLANCLGNIFWSIPSTVIPIMVLNLLGADPTAYFAIVWAIVNAFTIISGALSLSLLVESSYEEEKMEISLWRSLKTTFLILVPVVIILAAIADKVLLIFGDAYSESGTTLLRILAPALLPSAIINIHLSIKRVEKKLKAIVGLTAFVAAATLGLSYWLIPEVGINGVGIAWLGTQGIVALAILVNWRRPRRGLGSAAAFPK